MGMHICSVPKPNRCSNGGMLGLYGVELTTAAPQRPPLLTSPIGEEGALVLEIYIHFHPIWTTLLSPLRSPL